MLENLNKRSETRINELEKKISDHMKFVRDNLNINQEKFKILQNKNKLINKNLNEKKERQINKMHKSISKQISNFSIQISSIQQNGSRNSSRIGRSRSIVSRGSEGGSLYENSRPVSPSPNDVPLTSTLLLNGLGRDLQMPTPSFCTVATGVDQNAGQEYGEYSYSAESSSLPRRRSYTPTEVHDDLNASFSSSEDSYGRVSTEKSLYAY